MVYNGIQNVYDDFGNVTTQVTVAGDDANKITSTVVTVYKERGSGTVKYLPKSISSTRAKAGETDYIRKKDYVYNDNGSLIKETVDSANVNKVITEYKDFDNWGHARTVEVSITGKPVRKSTVTYTPSGYYIASKTNQLLEPTNYQWDETLGLLQNETDAWGRITTYAYDAWNKLLFTTYPDEVRKGSVLQWAAGAVPGAVYYNYSETKGSSPVWTWYNALGQEVRKDYYGLNEKKICVSTEYNSKKQVYRVSDPYFESESAYKTWAATYTYDNYGRPLTVTTAWNVSTTTYSTRTTTVTTREIGTNALLNSSETVLNSAGQTQTSTINNKSVNYTYYPSGLTKTSTPQGGQAITMEYNLQGKRNYMKDPDAGEVFSTYNGFGELTEEKQKVHNTQYIVTTNNYNDYGILTSIVRNGETTTYAHDDSEHKGRVTTISIANKNTRYFEYDEFDRIYYTSETIGNRGYETYIGYDTYSRLIYKQYPSGYSVSNTYDKYGSLTEVKDGSNRPIWKVVTKNARGQITEQRKGNLDTYSGFDARGLPTYISADNVESLEYGYDSKANLQYRNDYQNGQSESFHYDAQNRLTNWDASNDWGGTTKNNTIVYDPNTGTISSKTDAGTMKYGTLNNEAGIVNPQPGPHALTSVDGPLATSQTLTLNVTYTDFKKIKILEEGNKHYELTYGVDDQRCKSEYKVNNQTQLTRYYLGDYEEEIDANGNLRQIHYLSGGAVMIINNGEETLYYGYTDFQGSLIALVDESANVVEKYAYDPWGARRNPDDWTQSDSRTSWILNRGYTGHEHLDAFGIINMNGRVYDPATAMFFSPDPYVQAPGNWLNYNRYGYCMGNPFKYTDPSGYWFGVDDLIVAGIGLVTGYVTYGIATGDWGWKALAAGGATAVGAWLVWNTAGAALALLSQAYSTVAGGILTTAGLLTTDVGYDLQKLVSPVAIHLNIGLTDSKFGWEVSAGVPQVLPGYRYEYGETDSNVGKETVEGGEWAFGIFKYSSHTFTGGSIPSQTTNKTNIGIPGFNLQYENDKDDININLPGIKHAEGDKYRTSAGKLTVYGISVGYNLMTGEDDGTPGEVIDGYRYHNEKNARRLGSIYIGAGPLKFGFNSETIRNFFQNELIHKPNHYPLWKIRRDLLTDSFYWYFGSTGGNTLW